MNTNKEIIDDNLWAKKCGGPVRPHTLHTPKSATEYIPFPKFIVRFSHVSEHISEKIVRCSQSFEKSPQI